jgi:hypothetical protein
VDLFAAYNDALWPVLVALWLASALAAARLLAAQRLGGCRMAADRAYSLAYPAINAVEHHNLILATPHSWRFAIIPVI